MRREKVKKALVCLAFSILIPTLVTVGYLAFGERRYAWIILSATVLFVASFFLYFEKTESKTGRLLVIASMTALSCVGRVVFAPIPGFKPVTAITVICAIYFGAEAGFMTGAMSALISNLYFGQGPWTPFQMFGWGIIGFFAGLLSERLKKGKAFLLLYALFSGVLYSLIMDVWTVLWADGFFNLSRYAAASLSALPFTAVYVVSNAVFLLIGLKPVGKVLERIKTKYNL